MHGSVRHRHWWLAVSITLSVLALALPVAAQADDTWSGASLTSQNWSSTGNWTGGVAPSNPAGTLTFPDLGSCAAPVACYRSHNDRTGISASGLVFSNTTAGSGYNVVGNGLVVGAGGITDVGGHSTTATLGTPLSLSAAQTWTIGSSVGYDDVSLAPPAAVRGPFSLGVAFPARGYGDLFVDSDMEVGPVTVTGVGGFHIGAPTTAGSVNGTDGQPVVMRNGPVLVANPEATVGPLSLSSASLLLGTGPSNTKTTTLRVNGTASLDSASTTTTYVNDNGATPGVDYSQVSASGAVSLGGALDVDQGTSGGTCVALNRGDVATLVSTTQTLSGTFSNAPNGAVLTMPSSCQATAPEVQIAYTANSVTATVVSGTTPTATTLATPSPSRVATNQPVTLSAAVSTLTDSTITPTGTVAFFDMGNPVAGCASQFVSGSGSSGTATCVASFAAGSSPEVLTATFSAAATSAQAQSSSSSQSLIVNRDSTTTSVAASHVRPGTHARVTYTATVTPAHAGTSEPSGTVRFLDQGRPIAGCAGRALTAHSSSSTATCTVLYPRTGSHWIAGGYPGDANFGASSSALSATTGPATHVDTTHATLTGSITPRGATVTWQFQYGQGARYTHHTPLQTIAAAREGPVSVSRALRGLSANVRYHFRLVVSTRSLSTPTVKTFYLKDRMFTTSATGRLLLPTGRLPVIRDTIVVPVNCQSGRRCNGRLSITSTARVGKKKHRAVLCTTEPFAIRAHGHATVRARITGACLRLLKSNSHHRIAVRLIARLRTGQRAVTEKLALALSRGPVSGPGFHVR